MDFLNEESHYGEPEHAFCFTLYMPIRKSQWPQLSTAYPWTTHQYKDTWKKASGKLCLFYRLLATIILHLRKHKLLNSGDELMLCYLYLPLTHLAGGQNCVTWALSLGSQAGHLYRTDCAGNVGTPAQLTTGKPSQVGLLLETPCMQINFGSVTGNKI
jgi:hypothetical protein